MSLQRIRVADFRCLQSSELVFDPHFTLITGPNAAGKTSVLEAVYLLGRGRSFRTRRLDHLIRSGTQKFTVYGETERDGVHVGLGIEGSPEGMRARMGGARVASLADLAAVLPVQIIDPEVHHLIDEGPSGRRRFLDWGVFHVEHGFVHHWQRYAQVLRQRNAALKARLAWSAISAWDGELVRVGTLIHESRERYLDALVPIAVASARNLLDLSLAVSYRSGWARDSAFAEALLMSSSHDQETGSTTVGPHRADISFRLGGELVRDRISRGQQKLLAAALLIAQLELFPKEGLVRPTLLLDDPAAELDTDRLLGLIREVRTQALQLIVTSLTRDFAGLGAPGRVYDMSNGAVSAR